MDKYYELRKANTIIIKRSSTPYINPYTLEQMTSSDRYLDGYEPTKYSVLIDTRYEDPIVNIIPKELFFTEGKYVYYGEEYIFAINTTYETHTDNVNYYASRVVVFDIDVTDPRVSQIYDDSDTTVDGKVAIAGYNIFVDIPIFENYCGIVNNNSKFQRDYHVDDSQDKVVIESGTFLAGYGLDQSPLPIYMDLEYLSGTLEGADNNYVEDYLSYESIHFNLDNNTDEYVEELTNDDLMEEVNGALVDWVFTNVIEELLSLFGYDTAATLFDLTHTIFSTVDEYNRDKEVEKLLRKDGKVLRRRYDIDDGGTSSSTYKTFFLALPIGIEDLIDRQSFDYNYGIGVKHLIQKGLVNNLSDPFVHTHCVEEVCFRGALYDYSGSKLNYIRLGGINNDYYDGSNLNDNEFIYDKKINYYGYMQSIVKTSINSVNYSRSFNLNHSNEYAANMIYSSINRTIVFSFSMNAEVVITDYYGRTIISSNNGYFTSNKLFLEMEADNKYIIVVHSKNNSIGNIGISGMSPLNISNSYTYNNSSENVLIFKLESSSNMRTYRFFTNSNQDTRILIYGENGNIKAYNDDAYYDPNSDEQDYNAALTYHVNRFEIIYIYVYANGVTPYSKDVTFNAYLW